MYGNAGLAGAVEQWDGGHEDKMAYLQKRNTLTMRENINEQIERAEAELERLKGIRDRIAPELLDQRIVDLQQAMQF